MERCFGWGLEGLVLPGYDFSSTEVDVFDHAVVIEKNVCEKISQRGDRWQGGGRTYFQA